MRCRGTPDPRDESLAAHLMRVRDDTGQLLPHARQWSELSVFFYAGMETTAHTIAWCAELPHKLVFLPCRDCSSFRCVRFMLCQDQLTLLHSPPAAWRGLPRGRGICHCFSAIMGIRLLYLPHVAAPASGDHACRCIYAICQNPEVEANVAAELDAVGLLATPDRPEPRCMEHADLTRLTYLQCVIKVRS